MPDFSENSFSSGQTQFTGKVKKRQVIMLSKSPAEALLESGKKHFQCYIHSRNRQELTQAVDDFQKGLELDEQNPQLYLYLANTMWEQGSISLELAKHYCQVAIQLDSQNWEAYYSLACFNYQEGFTADAIYNLQQAIVCNPFKSSKANILLAQLYFGQCQEHPKLSKQLQCLLNGGWNLLAGTVKLPLDTNTFGAILNAILMDSVSVSLLSTASVFDFLRLKTLSKNTLLLGSKLIPHETVFEELLADRALKQSKDTKTALGYYQVVLNKDPNNVAIIQKLSRLQNDLDNKDMAKDLLEKALYLNQNNIEAHFNLAQVYIEETAFMKALFHLKEAERLNNKDPYVHSNMAYVLFKLDDIEGALNKYKNALEWGTNPEWISTVSHTIASIYTQVYHDRKHAAEYYQKAIDHSPGNLEAWSQMAQIHFDSGKLDQALLCYRHLLEYLPENSECYCNIGYILWQLDQNDQAIEAYHLALQFDPQNVVAKNNLGVIYLDEKEQPEMALELFEEALLKKNSYTMACFNRARALELLGRRQEAASAYALTKQLNLCSPELDEDEIEQHLRKLFY